MAEFGKDGLPVREGGHVFLTKESMNEARHAAIAKENVWKKLMPYITGGDRRECVAQGARTHITKLIDAQEERLDETLGLCESPIERLMLIALAYIPLQSGPGQLPAICDILHDPFMSPTRACITPQFSLGRYRLDFYIQWDWDADTGNAKRLCVECDGKDFHEWKTDTIRDGFLASFGIETERFTGAEIYKREGLCALPIEWRINGNISQDADR